MYSSLESGLNVLGRQNFQPPLIVRRVTRVVLEPLPQIIPQQAEYTQQSQTQTQQNGEEGRPAGKTC